MYDRNDSAPALLSFLIGGIIGALTYDFFIGRPLLRANALQAPVSGMDPTHREPTHP